MLPSQNRLIKKEDFRKVCQEGDFFSFGGISLKVVRNNLDRTRLGFLVGKKILKKASERNKAKKLLRNLFLKYIKKMKKGYDIAVFCKVSKNDMQRECNQETINKLLKKSKLLIKNKTR